MVVTHPGPLSITIPITTEFLQIAQRFAQQCPFQEKAEQIRQNTLAVCAVNAYLQLMDIPTAVSDSDSWNPMMQMMTNAADLKLPGVGTLSCRTASAEATTCHIPPEDWHDRAGYVAVTLDEATRKATLLGFVDTVPEIEDVPLSNFGPIEALLDHVYALRTAIAPSNLVEGIRREVEAGITQLAQWLEGTLTEGWQAAKALVNPPDVSFAFRGTELVDPATTNDISRAKLVDLGIQLGQSVRVALVVHLTQVDNGRTNIVLQVRPLGDSPYLVEGLSLTVLDEQGNTFMQASSRAIDNYIQLQLSGQSGEHFGIQVSMGDALFEEQFVI
ncbi:MAG: DUF1822 family protein [Cyanobacteria bacterium J06623_5]